MAFSQKVLIFQINGLWICDMYNIIDNISKIFETCDNPFKKLLTEGASVNKKLLTEGVSVKKKLLTVQFIFTP